MTAVIHARRRSLSVTITPFGAPHVVAAALAIDGLLKGPRVSQESLRTEAVRMAGVQDLVLGGPAFERDLVGRLDLPTRLDDGTNDLARGG